ncbi:MAG: hypothetical protein ACI9LS_000486, partial [Flavobacteriales bacterium]
ALAVWIFSSVNRILRNGTTLKNVNKERIALSRLNNMLAYKFGLYFNTIRNMSQNFFIYSPV